MSRPAKIALALATVWGPVYLVFFIVTIVAATIAGGGEPDGDLPIPFGVLFALHMFTILLGFVLIAAYVIHAYRSERVPADRRTFWAVVLFLGNFLAFPIYFWLYIRPDQRRPGGDTSNAHRPRAD